MIRIKRHFQILCLAALAVRLASPPAWAGDFKLTDIFGRSLEQRGVTLVDWEGQIANPAIEIFVSPPIGAAPFPTTATISASGARLYFDSPSRVGALGPSKVLTFQTATSSVPVRLSVFPDRDGADEDYSLTLRMNSAPLTNSFPLHVIDQDIERRPEFKVTVDFSRDRSGFFKDQRTRAIVEQAAEDWAYFIGDMQLDAVPAGGETTFIGGAKGFADGVWVTNTSAYRGFLFYANGLHGRELRSSGGASDHTFQSSRRTELALRRSGSCVVETAGNYNSSGWFLTQSDEDWWVSRNLKSEPNDFYSIAHHEIGHALFFSAAHPRFGGFKSRGALDDAVATDYQGAAPALDDEDHFVDVVDRASGCGAFGSEYSGDVPRGRWLVTKLDLLTARALGYRVRQTSALTPLELAGGALPVAMAGESYTQAMGVSGGVPSFDFAIVDGVLPAGLTLDRFSGAIAGKPVAPGASHFTVRARDQDPAVPVVTASFSLVVMPPPMLALGTGHDGGRRKQAVSTDNDPSPGILLMAAPTDVLMPSGALPLYRASPR